MFVPRGHIMAEIQRKEGHLRAEVSQQSVDGHYDDEH